MTKKKGLGKKKAIVAIARRLGALLWTLLRHGTKYEERHLSECKPATVASMVEAALAG
jgi:hypothetical protein